MISDKKFIKDIYSVQKFQNYFQPYVRILITLTVLTALLSYIVRRTGGLLGEMINPYTRILMIITASTAVIFLPYILFMLYKENRKGWISFLIVLVFFPFLFLFMIFQFSMFYNMAALFPIFFYTLFCYLLKSQISEWLSEYYGHQNRLEQKRLKEERINNGLFD